jgi:RNA-directed DNA polymerase
LMRRSGRRGVGFRQISNEYLYETLGLYSVPRRRVDLPRAKVLMGREKAGCGKSACPV